MRDNRVHIAGFFDRNIHDVARDVIGRELVRRLDGMELRGRVVEVEVYEGANDPASHASKGEPTQRTQPMFASPGTIYVYTIYGMYQCLNLRAPSTPGPGAILIRALAPLAGKAQMAVGRGLIDGVDEYDSSLDRDLLSGPGKLCQALEVDTDLSGEVLGDELWIEPGEAVWRADPQNVEATPRVGLNRETCGECVDWPWRYIERGSDWCS